MWADSPRDRRHVQSTGFLRASFGFLCCRHFLVPCRRFPLGRLRGRGSRRSILKLSFSNLQEFADIHVERPEVIDDLLIVKRDELQIHVEQLVRLLTPGDELKSTGRAKSGRGGSSSRWSILKLTFTNLQEFADIHVERPEVIDDLLVVKRDELQIHVEQLVRLLTPGDELKSTGRAKSIGRSASGRVGSSSRVGRH